MSGKGDGTLDSWSGFVVCTMLHIDNRLVLCVCVLVCVCLCALRRGGGIIFHGSNLFGDYWSLYTACRLPRVMNWWERERERERERGERVIEWMNKLPCFEISSKCLFLIYIYVCVCSYSSCQKLFVNLNIKILQCNARPGKLVGSAYISPTEKGKRKFKQPSFPKILHVYNYFSLPLPPPPPI